MRNQCAVVVHSLDVLSLDMSDQCAVVVQVLDVLSLDKHI